MPYLIATFGSGSQLTARWLSITPLTHGIIVHVIEVRLCHLDDGSKVTLVLRLHIGDSKASCCLHANHGTKASLALDNAVWNPTGLAQAWKPHNNLTGHYIRRVAASTVGRECEVHFIGWTAYAAQGRAGQLALNV